ncbi:hypothetical protein Val02_11070 [Virgisporangium aliadipatigenens]|uniref:DUF1152 domain-containing protein n=1 Tax=Virgisporangium aliadipatigenens TaxID=741659 RepID=A0A8J3YFT1_9ACTN|nr:DUF1152 domain-containing protein [Virgisporangium aliadipatigenens]GIJ44221.1 hypothetical protein Val02_11070 [Virgisporangium aliadipatigenens]
MQIPRLDTPPLFAALAGARNVLIAGAGGGFDVYAGLPLAFALSDDSGRDSGTRVHLANLSFTPLEHLPLEAWDAENVAVVEPDTPGPADYFPERTLARWLHANDLAGTVYAFPRVGVVPLRAAYRHLVQKLDLDAIVLVDGGTDILMRGDESGLGTPEEDMTSLAAVAGLDEVATKLVTCLGFGIDAYHGVNHSQVLENIAALDRDGAYLGALSIPSGSAAATLYRAAVEDARAATPLRPSIVNGQIAAAVAGGFGDVRFTERTSGSTLFVNPLMAVYFSFTVEGLAKRSLYLDRLARTHGMGQVALLIAAFRAEVEHRPARAFPH